MYNMEDILARLQKGERIEDIGNEIANVMNQAVAAHNAEIEAKKAEEARLAAEKDKADAKRALMEELIDIVKEFAILEGMDESELEISDEEVEQLIAAFTEMFAAMRDLKKMLSSIEASVETKPIRTTPGKATVHAKTDEQILADFLKMFN